METEVIANSLFRLCNNKMYELYGCVDWNMKDYCFREGFYSKDNIVDDDGNIHDSINVVTRKDLQAACDCLGIDLDVAS